MIRRLPLADRRMRRHSGPMLTLLQLTAPIFILIALGYMCFGRGLLPSVALPGMGRYVILLAMPALLFKSLIQQRIGDLLQPRYLAVYALGSLTVFFAGFFNARLVHRLGTTASAFRGIGMSSANSGLIGLPLVLQVIGPHAVVATALTFTVENLLMIPLMIGLAESGVPGHAGPLAVAKRIVMGLITSPLILSMIAACIGLALGLRPSGIAEKVVDMLAGTAAPVALVVVGGSLCGLSAKGIFRRVSEVVIGKLILHPLAIFAFLMLIPIADRDLRHTAILLASTQMLSIYPVLAQPYGEARFCAAAQLVTNICAFFTISTILWLLTSGWLPV